MKKPNFDRHLEEQMREPSFAARLAPRQRASRVQPRRSGRRPREENAWAVKAPPAGGGFVFGALLCSVIKVNHFYRRHHEEEFS